MLLQRFRKSRFILALVPALVLGTALAATAPLPAFTAKYQVLQNGTPIGEATLTLAPSSNGGWTFTTRSKGTQGLAAMLGASTRETSTFRWVGTLPQCNAYDYAMDSGVKQQHRSVRCNWTKHTITVDDKGTHTFAAKPGTLERHTVPLAIAAGLANGKTKFELPVAVRDRVEMQQYATRGRQKVKVPAGTYDATRVVRTGDENDFDAWFDVAKSPAPIKIDQHGKLSLSLELENWSAH